MTLKPLNGYMLNWNHTNWFISLIIMVVFEVGFVCLHICPIHSATATAQCTVHIFDTFSSFVFIVNLLSSLFLYICVCVFFFLRLFHFNWYFALAFIFEMFNWKVQFFFHCISCHFRLNALCHRLMIREHLFLFRHVSIRQQLRTSD